jgi:UDP-N-acetylglucosamine 2-epimerase
VIDCGDRRTEIVAALRQALKPEFRSSLRGLENPYGTGTATTQTIHQLKTIAIDDKLIRKRFMKHEPAFG